MRQGTGNRFLYLRRAGPRFLDAENAFHRNCGPEGSPRFGSIWGDLCGRMGMGCGRCAEKFACGRGELAGAEARSHCAAYGASKAAPFQNIATSRVFPQPVKPPVHWRHLRRGDPDLDPDPDPDPEGPPVPRSPGPSVPRPRRFRSDEEQMQKATADPSTSVRMTGNFYMNSRLGTPAVRVWGSVSKICGAVAGV
jgi:hypothetical protein